MAAMCFRHVTIHQSQLLIVIPVIRYYLDGNIYERFLGFEPAKKLDASFLLICIKQKLANCGVDLNYCVAVSYTHLTLFQQYQCHLKNIYQLKITVNTIETVKIYKK